VENHAKGGSKMEKIIVVFDEVDPKKHSIRYNAHSGLGKPAIASVYINREHLPKDFPRKIRITVEAVD